MDALLIVDYQRDFLPGGALPVPGGDEIAIPISRLIDSFELVVATRDWHPADHGSFLGADVDPARWQEDGDQAAIWPAHCVQGTPGAGLDPAIDPDRVALVVDKGEDRWSQGYSAFEGTPLADFLHEHGVERLYVAGLATEFCVKRSVLDARSAGFAVVVVADAIRGVDAEPDASLRAIAEMVEAGATLATTEEITAQAAQPRTAGTASGR